MSDATHPMAMEMCVIPQRKENGKRKLCKFRIKYKIWKDVACYPQLNENGDVCSPKTWRKLEKEKVLKISDKIKKFETMSHTTHNSIAIALCLVSQRKENGKTKFRKFRSRIKFFKFENMCVTCHPPVNGDVQFVASNSCRRLIIFIP